MLRTYATYAKIEFIRICTYFLENRKRTMHMLEH